MGQFTLSTDKGQDTTQVEIRNMEGRKVYSRHLGYEIKKTLTLPFERGMHLIIIITEDGLMTSKKMIIH
jgi:hypothetical protein